jgi:hypothetical protein
LIIASLQRNKTFDNTLEDGKKELTRILQKRLQSFDIRVNHFFVVLSSSDAFSEAAFIWYEMKKITIRS